MIIYIVFLNAIWSHDTIFGPKNNSIDFVHISNKMYGMFAHSSAAQPFKGNFVLFIENTNSSHKWFAILYGCNQTKNYCIL